MSQKYDLADVGVLKILGKATITMCYSLRFKVCRNFRVSFCFKIVSL